MGSVNTPRIYLSPPHMSGEERALLLEAFDSNWIAPAGPQLAQFERDLCRAVKIDHAVALTSGTAALHLALLVLGVGPGDTVVTSDLTFAASANAIRYVGATPIFVDSDQATWNLSAGLLEELLERCARENHLPRAAIIVDLYGQCADYGALLPLCERYRIPVIEDAAEALGATFGERAAGTLGALGVYSFNGNKIITTSGGGMLVSRNPDWIARARHLSTQAREATVHYEHREVGFNYRLSNLLAAVGVGQLRHLDERVERRRAICASYQAALADQPGIDFMPEAPYGRANRWLTCILIDPDRFGADRDAVRLALEQANIEARPLWKPMHLQPVYRDRFEVVGGEVGERLYERGLCLPSGSSLTGADLERIVEVILQVSRGGGQAA